jgi:hypothetical protein
MPWLADSIKCTVCGKLHDFYGEGADGSVSTEYEFMCPTKKKKGKLKIFPAKCVIESCPDGAVRVFPLKRT